MTMSTDRELLELAAKAAQLPECGWMGPAFMYVKDNILTEWDPLTDDGDALRLAVALQTPLMFSNDISRCVWGYGLAQSCVESNNSDPNSATRRAIVRAAAEIGRSMP